ncbi:hypothetical protein QQS21_002685 [Conoideocrella luteorostrata]|uniref:Peptidase S8/S53 domain-containing protein n=1 Tax=Conoideocrella luteorostrata TaxID=1105319 RepID=A0AAJ0CVQ7_9HYPO|nr:hypothetical protein QQS21_002685 [Conoideocrella luteorostrata]
MRVLTLFILLPMALAGLFGRLRLKAAAVLSPTNQEHVIPGRYIVVLQKTVSTEKVQQLAKEYNADPRHIFIDVLKGFSANLNPAAVQELRNNGDVDFLEQDTRISIEPPAPRSPVLSESDSEDEEDARPSRWRVQQGAPWGLGRISNKDKYRSNYCYHYTAGAGTCSYIIDTGIDPTHPDFQGRARQLVSFTTSKRDNSGHGTRIAGIVGGKIHGVAKRTRLFGVKVADDHTQRSLSTVLSNLIAGINFVTKDHPRRKFCQKGIVVLIGIAVPRSRTLNQAAAALVKSGAFVAVPAGDSGIDASSMSPASEPSVCTVGVANIHDSVPPQSNHGKRVDIFAPGVFIKSTYKQHTDARFSGSAAAAAHVAGLGAYLGAKDGFTGAGVCPHIRRLSIKGQLRDVRPNTVNALAYNNAGGPCNPRRLRAS